MKRRNNSGVAAIGLGKVLNGLDLDLYACQSASRTGGAERKGKFCASPPLYGMMTLAPSPKVASRRRLVKAVEGLHILLTSREYEAVVAVPTGPATEWAMEEGQQEQGLKGSPVRTVDDGAFAARAAANQQIRKSHRNPWDEAFRESA
jgi:hypothetical protein